MAADDTERNATLPKVELRHLHYLTALAEEMSFSRAAKRLTIAQPALSQQVKRLERRLGVDLLQRSAGRFSLTPAGLALVADAQDVLRLVASAVNRVQSIGKHAAGRLDVGVRSIVAEMLPEAIRSFHQTLPDVEVVLHERITEGQLVALRERRLDIAFALAPVDPDGVVVETLATAETMLVLPADHPLANRQRISLTEVKNLPMILFSRSQNPFFHDQIVEWCRSVGFAPITYEAEPNTMSTLVAAGFGVSVAPSWSGGHPGRLPRIVLRQVDGPAPSAPINLITRKEDNSRFVAMFRDCVKQAADVLVGRAANQSGAGATG